jgi:hypothetical protein
LATSLVLWVWEWWGSGSKKTKRSFFLDLSFVRQKQHVWVLKIRNGARLASRALASSRQRSRRTNETKIFFALLTSSIALLLCELCLPQGSTGFPKADQILDAFIQNDNVKGLFCF